MGLRRFLANPAGDERVTLHQAKGCEHCGHTGYFGRESIMEIMPMSDALRSLVMRHATSGELRTAAIGEGMETMYENGLKKAVLGVTTMDEVLRVTRED